MSMLETLPRFISTNGSERTLVRRAPIRHTETRTKECGDDTTDAESRLRALEERANAVLRASAYHPVRNVLCEVDERVLILRGRVPSFYLKQVAQTVVRDLLRDGFVIDNRVVVDGT